MKRILVLQSCVLIACGAKSSAAISPQRPNIIFILTDEHSYGMMGCTGNKTIQTPNLDQPFLLNLNFNIPHGATTRTMRQRKTDDAIYRTLYRDQGIPLPENYIAKADIKTPKLPKWLHRARDRQTNYDYVDTPKHNAKSTSVRCSA